MPRVVKNLWCSDAISGTKLSELKLKLELMDIRGNVDVGPFTYALRGTAQLLNTRQLIP